MNLDELMNLDMKLMLQVYEMKWQIYRLHTLSQKLKLVGLGPFRYVNYSFSLFFLNVRHSPHMCTHKTRNNHNYILEHLDQAMSS
jgi:hypothetical protein